MKQFRITTENINKESQDDCFLDPDDPIQEIKKMQHLAGLGYHKDVSIKEGSNISIAGNEKAELMRKHNIRPGTPEWFQLWFALPKLTGEEFGNKDWLR
jgi:hypothetical protein